MPVSLEKIIHLFNNILYWAFMCHELFKCFRKVTFAQSLILVIAGMARQFFARMWIGVVEDPAWIKVIHSNHTIAMSRTGMGSHYHRHVATTICLSHSKIPVSRNLPLFFLGPPQSWGILQESQTVGFWDSLLYCSNFAPFQAYFVFKTFDTHLGYIFYAFNMHGKYVYTEYHVNFKLQEWTPACIQEIRFLSSSMIILHMNPHCAGYWARF